MIGIIEGMKNLKPLNELYIWSGNTDNRDVQKQILHSIKVLAKKLAEKEGSTLVEELPDEFKKRYLENVEERRKMDKIDEKNRNDNAEPGQRHTSYDVPAKWVKIGGIDVFTYRRVSENRSSYHSPYSYGVVKVAFKLGNTISMHAVKYRLTKHYKKARPEDY